jgi:hypothetical protein
VRDAVCLARGDSTPTTRRRAAVRRQGGIVAIDSNDGWVSPIQSLMRSARRRVPTADVRMLERLAGMDGPPKERLEFLGG